MINLRKICLLSVEATISLLHLSFTFFSAFLSISFGIRCLQLISNTLCLLSFPFRVLSWLLPSLCHFFLCSIFQYFRFSDISNHSHPRSRVTTHSRQLHYIRPSQNGARFDSATAEWRPYVRPRVYNLQPPGGNNGTICSFSAQSTPTMYMSCRPYFLQEWHSTQIARNLRKPTPRTRG